MNQRFLAGAFLIISFFGAPSRSQLLDEGRDHGNAAPPAATHTIQGAELPDYYIVRRFFTVTCRMQELGTKPFASFLEKTFAIDAGSPAATVLSDAARRGETELRRKVVTQETVDHLLWTDPHELERIQRAGHDEKARRIGKIYGAMMAELAELGLDTTSLHHQIDAELRPTIKISLTADGDPNHMLRKGLLFRSAVTALSPVLLEEDQ